jgi:hypothetical protein
MSTAFIECAWIASLALPLGIQLVFAWHLLHRRWRRKTSHSLRSLLSFFVLGAEDRLALDLLSLPLSRSLRRVSGIVIGGGHFPFLVR